MYVKVYTCLDITYIVGVLDKYLSYTWMDYKKETKKVMLFFKRAKDYKLTYKRSDHLGIIWYFDSILQDYNII